MMKKFLILAILAATTFFALPAESSARDIAAQDRRWEDRRVVRTQDRRWNDGRRWRRGNRRIRETYGYRNYGQYRRTQVGNRRFRTVRRSFWDDGIRRTRLVRVYY